MNRAFVIADTHYRHSKVIEFESKHRPIAESISLGWEEK